MLETVRKLRGGILALPRIAKEIPIHMVPLGEVADRGVVHREISNERQGAFDVRSINEGEVPTYPMLWSHNCELERCFIVSPDKCGDVRPEFKVRADDIWEKLKGSKLHSNLDFQLNSQSLSMCRTPDPCIGGRAWPDVIPDNNEHEFPLLLWANSTLGLLVFWYSGMRQQQGRSILTISRLPDLPVLDVRKLTKTQLEKCQMLFDTFKERTFLPANEAYRDPVRKDLDAELFKMLDLGKDEGMSDSLLEGLDLLRRKWCSEPSVHGGKSTRPKD